MIDCISVGIWLRLMGMANMKPRDIVLAQIRHETCPEVPYSHSCGSVAAIVPDLIEIGLDVLESVQPEAADMNPYELKRRFGRDICFWGCLGSQSTNSLRHARFDPGGSGQAQAGDVPRRRLHPRAGQAAAAGDVHGKRRRHRRGVHRDLIAPSSAHGTLAAKTTQGAK